MNENTHNHMFLHKHQHLIDNKTISHDNRELLRVLLTSEVYFIPYSFDGEWDYMYSAGKVDFVKMLLKDDWTFDVGAAHLDDDVYIFSIKFSSTKYIKDYCFKPYVDHINETFNKLEIYIPFTDMRQLLHKVSDPCEKLKSFLKNNMHFKC